MSEFENTFHEVEEYRLSKKQKHTLCQIGQKLAVINPDGVEGRSELSSIEDIRYADTFASSGETNLLRPKLIGALIGQTERERRGHYLRGVARSTDYVRLIEMIGDSAGEGGARLDQLNLRMIIGATEKASLRAVSYPLPAMIAQRRIAAATGVVPTLEIAFASNIAGRLNGLDDNKVRQQQVLMELAISEAARVMGVDEGLVFTNDQPEDVDRVKQYGEILDRRLSFAQKQQLQAKGATEDLRASLDYAAAHYLMHDQNAARFNFFGADGETRLPGSMKIDFGGRQESFFVGMRDIIAQELGDASPKVPMIITRHDTPPYFMADGGDVGMLDFFESRVAYDPAKVARSAAYDLDFMSRLLRIPEDFHRQSGSDLAQNIGRISLHE